MEVTQDRKKQLQLSIMKKRDARGEGVLDIKFNKPVKMELTPMEKEKKERRREQNRRAAQRCRSKKRMNQLNAIKNFEQVIALNHKLQGEVFALKKERDSLHKTLEEHRQVCPKFVEIKTEPGLDCADNNLSTVLKEGHESVLGPHLVGIDYDGDFPLLHSTPKKVHASYSHHCEKENHQQCQIPAVACVKKEIGASVPSNQLLSIEVPELNVGRQMQTLSNSSLNHPNMLNFSPISDTYMSPCRFEGKSLISNTSMCSENLYAMTSPVHHHPKQTFNATMTCSPSEQHQQSTPMEVTSAVPTYSHLTHHHSHQPHQSQQQQQQLLVQSPPYTSNGQVLHTQSGNVPTTSSTLTPRRNQYPGLCRLLQFPPPPLSSCQVVPSSSNVAIYNDNLQTFQTSNTASLANFSNNINNSTSSSSVNSSVAQTTRSPCSRGSMSESDTPRSEFDEARRGSESSDASVLILDSSLSIQRDGRAGEVPDIDSDDVFLSIIPNGQENDVNNNSSAINDNNTNNTNLSSLTLASLMDHRPVTVLDTLSPNELRTNHAGDDLDVAFVDDNLLASAMEYLRDHIGDLNGDSVLESAEPDRNIFN